ncbi:hypothetical protein PHYSODRAFT_250283 [Phytophthora sojae]|uniref:RING-type domain-containing protein n=1 Tax=Phytophthora sojae (strain P6497) TaxID=1094619 RepID=G4Z9P1_PHYSP|nr:hypothetical protein PHYSODRAFT_250283 [Phytophthora sojae]EGZ19155.1 hypothetical protein PHYSODRAFT_250283 [Phytophthora sojae]|eukprot:XP_009521872.1 hypothetical protein PHYSODRAFT_250283 [Phytophthora sojae]
MALSIPVAWRDAHHHGLDGVVEICASDFTKTQVEGASVQDLIKLVNKKVRKAAPTESVVHEVAQMLLHGVRPLERGYYDGVCHDALWENRRYWMHTHGYVASIKARIQDKEGIAPEDQRLTHAGKRLQDHLTLAAYNIQNLSTVYLSARLLGGFKGATPTHTFADVSDGSIITAVGFSPHAPEWRRCSKGLNIEGRCSNPSCRAYRCMVIDRKRFRLFNLIRDDDIRCPLCSVHVTPVTCGLYDCYWRYEGVKANSRVSVSSVWEEASGYVYHRFNADGNHNSIEWASLVIMVKSMDEATPARLTSATESGSVSEDDTCSICWSSFGWPAIRATTTTHCGHTFHRVCTEMWSKQCKANNTLPSCPICRRTF